jgi:hypothetical protein
MNEAAQTFISLPDAADVDSVSKGLDRLKSYSTPVKPFSVLLPFYTNRIKESVVACR